MLIKRGIEEAYILVRFRNTAELSNGKIIMKKSENPQWRGLLSLGYGDEKEDYLQLHPVEAMYLLILLSRQMTVTLYLLLKFKDST
mgnify:CR=1 FL=1